MPDRIPISAARCFAKEQQCRYVVIFAWDGERSHVVTYGAKIEDSSRAADLGNQMKAGLGWPETSHAQPSRVRKLQARIKELEEAAKEVMEGLNRRIDEAPGTAKPVFTGIARLHAALGKDDAK